MTTGGINKPRLLVLDNVKYHKLFDAILGHEYELLATNDASEAVKLASSKDPDLILLSYTAENGDGIGVASQIRGSLSSVPILLMLTSDLPTLRRQAVKAGCNGFLIKPIDPDKLKSQIEVWLKGKS